MSHFDLAVVLPSCAAAWNLTGGRRFGNKYLPPRRIPGRVYQGPDGFFAVEPPLGWQQRRHDNSNEVAFVKGKISVSVATVDSEPGDTIEDFLEFKKSLVHHLCPAGEIWEEGKTKVAGAPGSYFTFLCPGSRNRTFIHISASLICGKFFIFKIAAPSSESPALEAEIARIKESFKPGEELLEECQPLLRAG
ncbi:MAG: hypothetical protein ABR907_11790 [Terracidiphilus sp.]